MVNGWFSIKKPKFQIYDTSITNRDKYLSKSTILVPTFRQAFRWILDKHDLFSSITPVDDLSTNKIGYKYLIYYNDVNLGTIVKKISEIYPTPEQAELESMCKIIEFIKSGSWWTEKL